MGFRMMPYSNLAVLHSKVTIAFAIRSILLFMIVLGLYIMFSIMYDLTKKRK